MNKEHAWYESAKAAAGFSLLLTCVIAGLAMTTGAVHANERVGDFALLDQYGSYHQMSWYNDQQAVVLLSRTHDCPTSKTTADAYGKLIREFSGKGFTFFLLNADSGTDRNAVQTQLQSVHLNLPAMMDESLLVAKTLGINKANEIIVYNPKTQSVSYRGQLDQHAKKVLSAIANNEAVPSSNTVNAKGCAVNYQALNKSVPSYSKEIAPLITENCASCHRDNGIAPFAMDSYIAVKGWSPMMREVVMTKRMPPAQIDPHIGQFDNLGLSVHETQTLVRWIDAGSPRDGNNDPLAELTWSDSPWPLGIPDLVVNVPAQGVPASGTVPYIWVDSGVELTEDRWVRGAQLIPGDKTVVHHVTTLGVLPGTEGPKIGICPNPCETGEASDSTKGLRLGGYVPGNNPQFLGDDVGMFAPKGTRFVFQMHYTTSGKATTDASKFGLYFHPQGYVPENIVVQAGALDNKFVIPPMAKDHTTSASFTLPRDAKLFALQSHMHLRGKHMQFTAEYPDGTIEPLISIPDYDFNWQRSYRFNEPKPVPKDTIIHVTGGFDNSKQNHYNPAPEEDVRWGDQSWEEMFIGFVQLQIPNPALQKAEEGMDVTQANN